MPESTDELPVEAIPDPALRCGIDGCEYIGHGKLPKVDLGRHRFSAHGIRTKSAAGGRATKRRDASKPRETTPREPTVSKRARDAAKGVTKSARRIGTIMYPRMPIAGSYVLHNSEELAEHLTAIAAGNPKLLAWLEKGEDAAAWIGLAWWSAGFVYAVGVDLERLPEDGVVAEELGVGPIVRRVDAVLDERERSQRAQGAIDVEPVEDGDRSPASILDGGSGLRSQDVGAGGAR